MIVRQFFKKYMQHTNYINWLFHFKSMLPGTLTIIAILIYLKKKNDKNNTH